MIKKSTRVITMLLTVAMLVSVVGCGKPAASGDASSKATSSAPVSSAAESKPESKAAEPAAPQTKEVNLAGVVQAASMNTLILRDADGNDLEFSTTDAKMECKDGLLDGDWAVVTYEGELKGDDTTGTKVTKVTDNSPHIDKAVAETKIVPIEQAVAENTKMTPVRPDMFTTAPLHVRDGYSTDANIIATLPKGAEVVITGLDPNGWKEINYDGAPGYVFGDFLSDTPPQAELANSSGTVTPLEQTVYTTDPLRLHNGPQLDATVVGVAPAGTSLHEVGTVGQWTLVLHDGATAYCDSEYLTTTPPAGAVVHTEGLPDGVTKEAVDQVMYTTAPLHLRNVCSTDSGIVATVANGTALHVTGILDNHWSEIQYNAQTLFCASEYLTPSAPAAAPVGRDIADVAPEAVFTMDQLHVRTDPSLGGKILETVEAGREFTRNGLSIDGKWSRIDYNGTTAYCCTQYLTTDRPSTMADSTETEVDDTVTTTDPLRLHATPDIGGQVLAVIPAGTTITRYSATTSGWSCVQYNDIVAYCSTQYLK